jgi:protoporphyrinogen oxidase
MHDLGKECVVILGAGPTGLGAARRLAEIGDVGVRAFDENPCAGGLSPSFVDKHGFTWDIGGHVQFSHYRYFDNLMNELLGDQWLEHMRESWVWMRERFIPYPLQNNIHMLPRDDFQQCLRGLIDSTKRGSVPVANFREWIETSFGRGLAELFMLPYNFKVWAHQPASMSYDWVGERVATVDLLRVVSNALDGTEEKSWGPNNRFRIPRPLGGFLNGQTITYTVSRKRVCFWAWRDLS